MKRELEVYIHIPFCIRKCAYCDFLSAPAEEETIERYVRALLLEIRSCRSLAGEYRVVTVFLGGGTPSVLSGKQMTDIFEALREVFEIEEAAEITAEANPGTVTAAKLEAYRRAGINRISFGLQSADRQELRLLGRIHTFEEFTESFRMARAAGFDNINVDLISAIPGQTIASWERTLREVVRLALEHISAYSLIVEEGTPFAKLYGEGCPKEQELPNEEEERLIYQKTEEWLAEAGYYRYEISNYAKSGKECRHNLGYWERKNYLGLGLGAASLLENVRYSNTDCLQKYITDAAEPQKIHVGEEKLSTEEQMEEFIFLGLRKMSGISTEEFQENFGCTIWERYGENVQNLIEKGLLEEASGSLKLTGKGIDISNYVFAELLYR